MATFPLKCIICSDKHDYSDISHLLTHMSSKRHLAAQFKASVRARQDPVLARRLYEFDQWYDQNNLAELLAERLAKKDEKKLEAKAAIERNGGQRNRKRVKKEEAGKDSIQKYHEEGLPGTGYHVPSMPIDPNMLIKEEPGLHTEDHNVPYCTCPEQHLTGEQLNHNLGTSEQGICKQCWPYFEPSLDELETSRYHAEYSWIPGPPESYRDENGSYGAHSMLKSIEDTDIHNGRVIASIRERIDNSSLDGEGEDDEDCPAILTKGKVSKLKGIIWPGMHLFDSASPEGIRMRNQRKKFEISGTLERSSQQTQPIEVIYYPETWIAKEDRVIDGEVHSPPPEDLPPPVKRQKRRVLAEKSTNKTIRKTDCRKGSYRRSQKLAEGETRQPSHTPCPRGRLAFVHEQHDTGTLLGNRGFYGSPVKLESYHDQFGRHELPSKPTAYPFITSYGFGRTGLTPRKTPQMNDQDSSGFPYYLAPLDTLHRVSDLCMPTSAFRDIDSRGSPFGYVSNEFRNKGLLDLDNVPIATRSIQRLPSIGAFDHFLSMPQREGIDHQTTYSQNIIQDQPIGQQCYIQSQVARPNDPKLNQLKTPIKRSNDDDYSAYRGMYEDGSGDETIDQGIDDTPTRYLTRSAIRKLRGSLS